ncbi:hypothetical protein CLOSTMETH_01935 [[Clostridium] methylpentosum DSM 5476]|jgi:hypothetical protein|uniref:Uncharacterized protein n=1 Tax=[Clostridium] methylpentosum DSM 5476 TaxID=537013 RepID=C0EDK7_9FIRM|nr:hypothetical protein CLOSTMETH_01935 [[Clostridium] methylpentosum DSM 5476]MDY3989161.1 hypothetical protein [Massilioclostridium sp.]MEE1491866.1 hypothetical protein [Massilioclostridium sp.]
MTFYVQKESETGHKLLISYNCGHRPTCDGSLSYDKETQEFAVLTLSSGASVLDTEKLYPALKRLIEQSALTEEKQKVEEHPASQNG